MTEIGQPPEENKTCTAIVLVLSMFVVGTYLGPMSIFFPLYVQKTFNKNSTKITPSETSYVISSFAIA